MRAPKVKTASSSSLERFKEALAATKHLHSALKDAYKTGATLELRLHMKQAKMANAVLAEASRSMAQERTRATVEKDALRAEMHAELVDREANAARVAERQRVLFERGSALAGQAGAQERAYASAAFVEAAVASLCPNAGIKPRLHN